MKKHLLFTALFLGSFSFAQTTAKKSVTFDVCDLQQKPLQVSNICYKNVVDKMCGPGVEAWNKGVDSLVYYNYNPFVATVREAYYDHRPLTLSPDMIWLLITQEFAIHVDQNSESLRHYFVDFDGKKVLKVEDDDLRKGNPDNQWDSIFPQFTKQIGENTGQELLNNTLADFSTTTPTAKAACEITLMDAMSSYFVYAVYTSIGCGIPKITLEGTTADWEKLRTKTLSLGKYDFKWWTDSIAPILNEFVDASRGEVDKDFWSKIYNIEYRLKSSGGCGGGAVTYQIDLISGWMLKFFPYQQDGQGKFTRRNNLMDPVEDPKIFPKGFASADFYWLYDDNGVDTTYQMQFIAGFMGMKIDRATGALQPEIGWAIRDTGKKGIKSDDAKYANDINKWPDPK
ncbi:MAG: DUF4419 domain-containing protein [Bacteroidetes bacterium]|nr:DUF4419 domain-containing protein [Bacteroidota bacterium]